MKLHEVQSLALRALSKTDGSNRLGRGEHYLAEEIRHIAPSDDKPNRQLIMAAYWSLVAQGLAYIDMWQSAPENWTLHLTPAGLAAVTDQQSSPDDPGGYLLALYKTVPDLPPLVRLYVDEAVRTYTQQSYLASTVMIGVGAEAAFSDVVGAFVKWSIPSATKLERLLENPRANYVERFSEFRRKLEEQTSRLPPEIRDGLDLQLGGVLDLLRASRNDAGHPTGRIFHRDDCFTALVVFQRLAARLYALKMAFAKEVP